MCDLQIMANCPPNMPDVVKRARDLAILSHRGVSIEKYIKRLDGIDIHINRLTADDESRAVSYLCDVVDVGLLDISRVRQEFGDSIADSVLAVIPVRQDKGRGGVAAQNVAGLRPSLQLLRIERVRHCSGVP